MKSFITFSLFCSIFTTLAAFSTETNQENNPRGSAVKLHHFKKLPINENYKVIYANSRKDRRLYAEISGFGNVHVYDTETNNHVFSIKDDFGKIHVDISPNSNYLLTINSNSILDLFRVNKKTITHLFRSKKKYRDAHFNIRKKEIIAVDENGKQDFLYNPLHE